MAGADEEDIALSAFKSFHRRVRRGDFPRLDDRDDLWVQLVTLTRQKIVDLRRRERALKRGRDRLVSEVDLGGLHDSGDAMGLAAIVGQGPGPAVSAIMTESAAGCSIDWAMRRCSRSPWRRWGCTRARRSP